MNSEQLFHKALKLDKQLIILRIGVCEERSARTNVPNAKCVMRSAFTLLELLLVIAIVAVLAGLILFALNPAQRLDDASDTRSLAKSVDIRKAIESYAIANNGSMPANLSNLSTYGLYDICKNGQSTDCINLDELVTGGYMNEVPVDDRYDTNVISGYKVEYDPAKKNVQIYRVLPR
jgi:prepilin-type N-terminal cleavage/methylation domain-containing protein